MPIAQNHMTNFGARILNTAVSSINAQQGVLAGISNNIANANTPGYARRSVLLENQNSGDGNTGLNIGAGVRISDLVRFVDEFTNTTLRESVSDKFEATTKDDLLSRIEDVFDLTGDTQTVGSALTDFFSSLNDLTLNPSSIELRSNVIQRAQDLVSSIQTAYSTMSELQQEVDDRLTVEVDAINNITSQIAQLNQGISQRENGGNVAADERDRRDYLLEELAKKISFTTVERDDGSINVTLQSGLDIVYGANSRALEVTATPSFAGSTLPPMLNSGVPSYIVYNYGSATTTAHVDLTTEIANGGGSLAGLLQVRGLYDATDTSPFQGDGILPEAAARIEAITRFLLTTFNTTYLGPDENSGVAGHQASSGDLNGATPSVFGFFDFNFSGLKDADGDGLPDDVGSHTGVTNYSSILQLTSTDPLDIAAARDLNTTAGATTFADGDSSNISALVALLDSQTTHTVGNYSYTGTINQLYVDAVSYVGNEKSKASIDKTVAEASFKLAADRRDEISAVSIDEEFTQMIKGQKAYEASARLIRVAQDLLDQIINLI